MARRRFQDPKPKIVGNWWWIRAWKDEFIAGRRVRKQKRIKLAPSTMPEREVRKIAAETLRPLNQGLAPIGSATRFHDFVETIYIPIVLPLKAKSTQDRYRGVITNYLGPNFGELCLRDLTALTVQRYFTQMATSPLTYQSRDKIRDVLSGILGSAVHFQLLVKNPVAGAKLPPAKKGNSTKPYIRPAQLTALVNLIHEPYATMVFVAVYTGLRVSELVGLKWADIHEGAITIDERFCRGDWGAPKSQASNATIAVNKAVIERIHRLKTLMIEVRAGRAVRHYRAVKSDGPDDLVFPSLVNSRPMRDNNILTRHIKPAARKLGLGFVNWRCLRTSHATWLKMVGADVKDAQAQLRHSRASTTLDIYQQFVPESQRRAVDRLTDLPVSGTVQ
jgi:integrase